MDNLEYLKEVEKSIQKKYKKKLWRPFCKAINQYELVDGKAFSRIKKA